MARSDGRDEIWGTREELILAGAVARHGTADWPSVAAAVKERTSFAHLVTAEVCERRYRDLCHRFQGEARQIDALGDGGGRGGDGFVVPWLEDLRMLRLSELRLEVQSHDVSIVSLQSKVRKMTEDRERSYLEKSLASADGSPPEKNHRERCSGRSCNDSNTKVVKLTKEGEDATPRPTKVPVSAGEDKVPGEGSCNGSSETVVMGKGREIVPSAGDGRDATVPRPPDSGDSMAESTGEDATKESSDVQSSASPSRRRKLQCGRRKPSPPGGNSEGESPEAKPEDSSGKSQPLVVLLEMIRSNKYGSVFERRLDSQDSQRYRSLIRQHMDLETVGRKLEEGAPYTPAEFFRDLLLLCTNATVFFPKDSLEHESATHLRSLVNSKLAPFHRKPTSPAVLSDAPVLSSPPQTEVSVSVPVAAAAPPLRQAQPATCKLKSEPELHTSLLDKVALVSSLNVCRKRSSLSGKTAKAAKEEAAPVEEKLDLERELENVEKKVMKEKPVARGLRTTKTRGPITKKPSLPGADVTPRPKPDEKEAGMNSAEKKGGADVAPVAKKRSAASFLNRLREGGSNNSIPGETPAAKNDDAGIPRASGEQKKIGKEERRKEVVVKRSVGRPPKRPYPNLPPQPPAKRMREADPEAASSRPPPPPSPATAVAAGKKRARR